MGEEVAETSPALLMPTTESAPKKPPRPVRFIPRERLDLVERMYLAGKSRQKITREVCDNFKVCSRTARHYIAIIEERLAALPKPPPEATAQRVEAMLLEAYELARDSVQRLVVSKGKNMPSVVEEYPQANVGVMVTVASRLADLHGVLAPQKLDVTSGGAKVAAVVILPPLDPMPVTVSTVAPDQLPVPGASADDSAGD